MLSVLGNGSRLCDGSTRREFMRVGGLSLFSGISLANLLRAEAQAGGDRKRRVRSVVLFNLLGGPSHMDMFDLKPTAPAEIRGEFRPISSSLAGVQICEHLPNTARLMHKACLIRTISHNYNSHDPLAIMTGYTDANPKMQAQKTDPPDIGAICQYVGLGSQEIPGAVCLPCFPGSGQNGYRRGGPYGGFLGSQYDPLFSLCDPTFQREPNQIYYDPVMPIGEPFLPGLDYQPQMTVDRFAGRRSLLQKLDDTFRAASRSGVLDRLEGFQQRAYAMLTSSKTRDAFDLSKEPASIRDAYGRHLYGSSMIVARRLVEIGVPFISVHQEIFRHYGHAYDMHENNFSMLKNHNLPVLDQIYPAFISDLESRGLLDSTLVIVMGEMGRSPKVNARAGRDHWPQCGFSLLTGGGIKAGMVHGSTDKYAAYPASDPVHPSELVATIYHLLGIDPNLIVHDHIGRPHSIARGGSPIEAILA